MRIALDATPLNCLYPTGVEKAFLQLLQGLAADASDHEYLLVSAGGRARHLPEIEDPRFRSITLGRAGSTLLWRERLAPPFAHRQQIDLWHSPVQAIPVLLDRPKVATLHELSWMETKGVRDEGAVPLRRVHAFMVAQSADRIICVSRRTQDNFLRIHPHAAERTCVIHHGVASHFFSAKGDRERLAARYGIPQNTPYILILCRALKRKGLPHAIRAFRVLLDRTAAPHQLVIAGPPTPALQQAKDLALRLGVNSRLQTPGWIDETDLASLYASSEMLLVPSESEGFGIPVLEAMASGTPVVASRAAALPEVAGGSALLVDTSNALAFAQAMQRLIDGEREEWIERGRTRAWEFPVERTVAAVLAQWADLVRR